MDGGAWWAIVHVVTKSRTRLSEFTFTFTFCGSAGKESACNVENLGWEDPLENGKPTHSNILGPPQWLSR